MSRLLLVALLSCLAGRAALAEEPADAPAPRPDQEPASQGDNPPQGDAASEPLRPEPLDAVHAAPPPLPQPGSPAARLAAAVRSYHAGQHDLALSRLLSLMRDESVDPVVLRDARVYMGEIFFVQGNEPGAREAFEAVVQDWPDHDIDPFRHPPDVCAFYQLVREAEVRRRAAEALLPTPEPVEPRTISPLMPFGVPQYRQNRPLPGLVFTLSQLASCGLSVGYGTWLLFDRRYDATPSEQVVDDQDGPTVWDIGTLRRRRTVQLTATGFCYGTYAAGVTDAALANKRRARRDQAAARTPPPLGITLTRSF